ncbi:hypothetical protein [Spirosoma linguale]
MRNEAQQQKSVIDKASARINQTNTSRQTDGPQTAFKFGLGKSFPGAFVALVLICIVSFFYAHSDEYEQVERFVSTTKNAPLYTYIIEQGQLIDGQTNGLDKGLYLKLSQPKGKEILQAGKHFLRSKNGKISYVPLHF